MIVGGDDPPCCLVSNRPLSIGYKAEKSVFPYQYIRRDKPFMSDFVHDLLACSRPYIPICTKKPSRQEGSYSCDRKRLTMSMTYLMMTAIPPMK